MSNESNEIRELTAAELDIVGGGGHHHHQQQPNVNIQNSFNFESFNGVGNGAIGNPGSFNGNNGFSLSF
jgi:hypothetical protein